MDPMSPDQGPAGMRRVVAGILMLLCSWGVLGTAEAAPPPAQLIQGQERAEVIARLQAQQREVTSVQAAVVQRKRHPLLAAEVTSEGRLLFKRPGLVRWEVDTPERTIIVIDGHTLLTYRPDRKVAEWRDLRDDFGARAAVEFFTSGLNLAVPDLEKRFQVDVYRENGTTVFLLTPRSRLVAQAIASVTIYRQDTDAVPRQIVVVGQKGDRTDITLSDITINPQVSVDAFTLTLGSDVRVTNVGKPAGGTPSDR